MPPVAGADFLCSLLFVSSLSFLARLQDDLAFFVRAMTWVGTRQAKTHENPQLFCLEVIFGFARAVTMPAADCV